jgi:hypothetical protein
MLVSQVVLVDKFSAQAGVARPRGTEVRVWDGGAPGVRGEVAELRAHRGQAVVACRDAVRSNLRADRDEALAEIQIVAGRRRWRG